MSRSRRQFLQQNVGPLQDIAQLERAALLQPPPQTEAQQIHPPKYLPGPLTTPATMILSNGADHHAVIIGGTHKRQALIEQLVATIAAGVYYADELRDDEADKIVECAFRLEAALARRYEAEAAKSRPQAPPDAPPATEAATDVDSPADEAESPNGEACPPSPEGAAAHERPEPGNAI